MFNKKYFCLYALYIIAALLMLQLNSLSINIVALIYIVFCMIFDNRFIIVTLGCCNILPSFLEIFTLIHVAIIVILLKSMFFSPFSIRFSRNDFGILALLLAQLIWLTVCWSVHHDNVLYVAFIQNVIFYLVFIFFLKYAKLSISEAFYGLLMGLAIVVVAGLFIQAGIPGFSSNHLWGRLAIGERSDPNSTGLLAMMLCVGLYLITTLRNNTKPQTLLYLVVLMLALYILFSTGSRGSAFTFILGCALATVIRFGHPSFKGASRIQRYFSVILFMLSVSSILIYSYSDFFLNSFDSLIERIDVSEYDGNRMNLVQNAIRMVNYEDPIFGVGIESFIAANDHHTHNIFTDYLVGGGWIACILFVTICLCGINLFYETLRSTHNLFSLFFFCLFVVLVINLSNYSAHGEKLFYVMLGIASQSTNMCREKFDTTPSRSNT